MRSVFVERHARLAKPDAAELDARNRESGFSGVIYVYDADPPIENLPGPTTWLTTAGYTRLKGYDGTRIVGLNGGVQSRGDESVTLTLDDAYQQFFSTALTANRTVTLPSTVEHDRRFRITLDAAAPGAFTLAIGGLKTIPASTRAFVDVVGVDSTWRLSAYGLL